uniref:Uncharacterized protein n=1 Tax=Physcomitrium patens TaxID=3218 RepID=A0A2K1KM74_PHYPA|nr:hypothetical protein PHYPA_005757 [Physcomitrium patens]
MQTSKIAEHMWRIPCTVVCCGYAHELEVAYSIALGSNVVAITLWDTPCHLQIIHR